MIIRKSIYFIGICLLQIGFLRGAREEAVQSLHKAIKEGDVLAVCKKLAARNDFTQEELEIAHNLAPQCYRQKDNFAVRTADSLVLPLSAVCTLSGIGAISAYYTAKTIKHPIAVHGKFEPRYTQLEEHICSWEKSIEPAKSKQGPTNQEPQWVINVKALKDEFTLVKKLQSFHASIRELNEKLPLWSDATEYNAYCKMLTIVALACAGLAGICYCFGSPLRRAREIVLLLEARMRLKSNRANTEL